MTFKHETISDVLVESDPSNSFFAASDCCDIIPFGRFVFWVIFYWLFCFCFHSFLIFYIINFLSVYLCSFPSNKKSLAIMSFFCLLSGSMPLIACLFVSSGFLSLMSLCVSCLMLPV